MADLWFYAIGGEQKGPVGIGDLQKIVKAGQAAADDLAWREGMSEWTPIAKISELAVFLSNPPLATPEVASPTLSVDGRLYAGFWIRVVAYLMDCAVCFVPVCAIAVIALAIGGYATANQTPETTVSLAPLWICMLVGLLVQWPYWAIMESSRLQATLGKMAAGVIVIDAKGNRLTFARATGRYFARVVAAIPLYLGLIMVAFDARKRGLHDRLAATFVVKKGSRA